MILLRDQFTELLAARQKDSTLQAFQLSESLPAPGKDPDDQTAQCLFDIGFSMESFCNDRAAAELFRRALQYAVAEPNIHSNAWFRLGLSLERLGNWFEALDCHRKCLTLAHDWPQLISLARLHLADLLCAAEEYSEAAEVYKQAMDGAADPVQVKYARCLLRMGEADLAEAELCALLDKVEDGPLAVDARQLLAEIHERAQNPEAAAECYSRIAGSSHADPHVRAAAAHRLSTMPKSKRGKRNPLIFK
ncbi:MAG: tetratricopeptide repeat protein [Acidobacteriota bacterium]|nr:tetratricopeptide repeat protein [Acidobacteriota bacterium]